MDRHQGSDCFPSTVITDPKRWKKYNLSANELKMWFAVNSHVMIPFIPQTGNPNYKIYYHREEKTDSITQHELRCINSAQFGFSPRPVTWITIFKKLTKPLQNTVKNCDQRLSFRFRSVFLTKCYFTFGFRTVEPNKVHLYQTGKCPILFYKLNPVIKHVNIQQRAFNFSSFNKFDAFVMQPDKLYYVKPETSYVLVTGNKTVFAVDVMTREAFRSLRKEHPFEKVSVKLTDYNKVKSKTARESKTVDFDVPPATPAMDQIHDMYYETRQEIVPKARKKTKKTIPEEKDTFLVPFIPTISSKTTAKLQQSNNFVTPPIFQEMSTFENVSEPSNSPQQTVNDPTLQTFVQPSFEDVPMSSYQTFVQPSFEDVSQQTFEQAPFESVSQQTFEIAPQEQVSMSSQQTFEIAPQEQVSMSSQQTFENAPPEQMPSQSDVNSRVAHLNQHEFQHLYSPAVYCYYYDKDGNVHYAPYPFFESNATESDPITNSVPDEMVDNPDNMPTEMPSDEKILEAIEEWLKIPNLESTLTEHFQTTRAENVNNPSDPPPLPLDLSCEIFD